MRKAEERGSTMATLTFSELAILLYPYCGNGATESEYIITMADKIMRGRPGRASGTDQYQNPLRSKSTRALQAYYKGTRPISKRDASILYANSDKGKFEEHLNHHCSDDSIKSLRIELEKKLNQGSIKIKDVFPLCADLYVEILKNLASRSPKEKSAQDKT